MASELTAEVLRELEALEAKATRPHFEVHQHTEMVLVGDDLSRYEDRETGDIPDLTELGNGESGFMTPERARFVATMCNHASALIAAAREAERYREALESIANHGTDLPAALGITSEEYEDGYRRGLRSCGSIARTALEPKP